MWKRNFSQETPPSNQMTFLQKFLGPKEMPPRGTLKWYGEVTLICTVFAITGTSTMVLVRFLHFISHGPFAENLMIFIYTVPNQHESKKLTSFSILNWLW